jgi:hypothetical protein
VGTLATASSPSNTPLLHQASSLNSDKTYRGEEEERSEVRGVHVDRKERVVGFFIFFESERVRDNKEARERKKARERTRRKKQKFRQFFISTAQIFIKLGNSPGHMYTHCHILQVYNYTKPLGF